MIRRYVILAVLLGSPNAMAAEAAAKFESLLDFQLNATTLKAVASRFGAASRFEVPDGHHEFAICYYLTGAPGIVMFSSGSEFGGPDELLLGFAVYAANPHNFPCVASTITFDRAVVDGLRLGIDESEFTAVVGEPIRVSDSGLVSRLFESQVPLAPEDLGRIAQSNPDIYKRPYYDVSLNVWGRFQNGALTEFGCWRLETL